MRIHTFLDLSKNRLGAMLSLHSLVSFTFILLSGLWLSYQETGLVSNIHGSVFVALRTMHSSLFLVGFIVSGIMGFIFINYSYLIQYSRKLTMIMLTYIGVQYFSWILLLLGFRDSSVYSELLAPVDLFVSGVGIYLSVFFGVNFVKSENKIPENSLENSVPILYLLTSLFILSFSEFFYNFIYIFRDVFSMNEIFDVLLQAWYKNFVIKFASTAPVFGVLYSFFHKYLGKESLTIRNFALIQWSMTLVFLSASITISLQHTMVPDYLEYMGYIFSVGLIIPSLIGYSNIKNLLRLEHLRSSNSWLNISIAFYALYFIEDFILSFPSIRVLFDYTHLIFGHSHLLFLTWTSTLAIGVLFHNRHIENDTGDTQYVKLFNLFIFGMIIFLTGSWISGVFEGALLNKMTASGHLMYPSWSLIMDYTRYFRWLQFIGALFLFFPFLYWIKRAGKLILAGRELN